MSGSSIDPDALTRIEAAAVEIANEAGRVLGERYRRTLQVEFKGKDRRDPVTEVDREIEGRVRDYVRRQFPNHALIGEETETTESAAEFVWVVDPVDGTANFIDGLPAFAVAVGVLQRGAPVVGAIYVPVSPGLRSGVLHARRGGGAWFDDERLPTGPGSGETRLCALPPAFRWQFQTSRDFQKTVGEVRSLGSIVYEIALVVMGTLRFAIFRGPKLWDVAAGAAIVPEVGGLVLIWDGRGWAPLTAFRPRPARRSGPVWARARSQPAAASLRSWSAPLLAGHPDAVRAVAATVRPRKGRLQALLRLIRRLRG